jgi:hypothetical protein
MQALNDRISWPVMNVKNKGGKHEVLYFSRCATLAEFWPEKMACGLTLM